MINFIAEYKEVGSQINFYVLDVAKNTSTGDELDVVYYREGKWFVKKVSEFLRQFQYVSGIDIMERGALFL